MAEYGVSRTVVREAITSLQAAGLIETRHGIGSFVRAVPNCFEFRIEPSAIMTARDVLEMLELRIGLETDAAAFAAARRTDGQIDEMRRVIKAFQANLGCAGETVEPDFQFHLQIAYATGNRYFVDIMRHLGTKTIPRTRVDVLQGSASHTQYLGLVNSEHKRIFEAILQRDPEGSRTAMRAHLVSSRERLRRAHDLARYDGDVGDVGDRPGGTCHPWTIENGRALPDPAIPAGYLQVAARCFAYVGDTSSPRSWRPYHSGTVPSGP